ncbi:hypothetical protein BHE90_000252 [Fusarium euwallaceae]|uniref:Uncharacterized protein n=1 Tax=Fusarium euwallaceae TaxID=1147111 RepID=A0A430MB89_9HYPO|nr:hypothetical protein BHE90_000252 [Fusarium euwallaceae]
MDTLRYYLGYLPARTQPTKVETDEIYPLHFNDDTKTLRELTLSWTARIDDVLDADHLHRSLARLLEMGDWRKLGGLLRLRASLPDGMLEIHVPNEFTPERPAVRYTREVFDVSINEHPLARRLPKSTRTASIQPGPFNFHPFSARKDAPSTLQDLLFSDEPQMSLHITSFTDATLVAILWPHTMTGALGLKDLVVAWCKVLAGLESEVPCLAGASRDVLDGVDTDNDETQEPLLLEPKELKGFKLLGFGLRFMWDIFWNPKVESCMLCLPCTFIEKLRQRAAADLKTAGYSSDLPFLSDGDILTAWMALFIVRARGGHRPATILSAVDVRDRLRAQWVPGAAYVQNLALSSATLMSAVDLAQASLRKLAHTIRQDLVRQGTDLQLRAMIRRLRAGGRPGETPVYGDPGSLLVVSTNWAKAKFFENTDFEPAVIKSGSKDEAVLPGKAACMHMQTMTESPWARNVFNILGKDVQGTHWVTTTLFS